jgi:N-carbamoylputrescine amidase
MSETRELKIGLIQMSLGPDRKANADKAADGAREAATAGAQLVVLPELHNNPYFCQRENADWFDAAEPIPGPSTEFFGSIARDLRIVLVISLFERRAPGLYHNTAAVLERDGTIAGTYRKMHIPDDPGYHEKFYFTPGDLGFVPIPTSLGKLGVLVCWDQWYPEAARLMALAGAEILLYPTAIGWEPRDSEDEKMRQLDAWLTVQRGHAVANGLPVATVNRVGLESDTTDPTRSILFWGSSFVAGCQGELFSTAPKDADKALVVAIDRNRSEAVRRIWPFLRDRRIDAYGDLGRRFRDSV